jgi:alpha-1,6-mannosyltransferase
MLANPLVEFLRGSAGGSLVARGFVFLGLAILLQAWLVLGADLLDDERPSLRSLSWIMAIWSAPLVLAPPMFSRDVYSYYVQGRLLEAGSDPTTMGVGSISGWFQDGADPMWAESPTPYGPAFLAIERAVASFAHPNAYLAALLLRLASLAGVALLIVFVPKLAAIHGVDPVRATWLAVLNPLVIMHFVSGAHNDSLMVGLLVVAFWFASSCRCVWGAALVGLAFAVKPIAIIALPFIGLLWAGAGASWPQRLKAWLLALLAFALTAASLFLAVDSGYGVLSAAFGTPSGVLTWLSPTTAVGQVIGYLTTAIGVTADNAPAVFVVRAIGTAAALIIIAVLILKPSPRSPVRGAALAIGALVVLGPVIQPWYLLWALPLFAVSGLTHRGMQVAVLVTTAFTVHGMVESSTTSDNFLDITDGITFVIAVAIVALVALASPRERRLLLGAPTSDMADGMMRA